MCPHVLRARTHPVLALHLWWPQWCSSRQRYEQLQRRSVLNLQHRTHLPRRRRCAHAERGGRSNLCKGERRECQSAQAQRVRGVGFVQSRAGHFAEQAPEQAHARTSPAAPPAPRAMAANSAASSAGASCAAVYRSTAAAVRRSLRSAYHVRALAGSCHRAALYTAAASSRQALLLLGSASASSAGCSAHTAPAAAGAAAAAVADSCPPVPSCCSRRDSAA